MEYSFLFRLMQKLCKSIKKCKTYSRKATGLFLPDTVYITITHIVFTAQCMRTGADLMVAVLSVCLSVHHTRTLQQHQGKKTRQFAFPLHAHRTIDFFDNDEVDFSFIRF